MHRFHGLDLSKRLRILLPRDQERKWILRRGISGPGKNNKFLQNSEIERGNNIMKPKPTVCFFAFLILAWGCGGEKEAGLDGHWRATWTSQAGEVPVDMVFKTTAAGELEGEIHNAAEVIKFSGIEKKGKHLDLFIEAFESLMSVDIAENGRSMSGKWAKQVGAGVGMPFKAIKTDEERFPLDKYPPAEGEAPIKDISGTWRWDWEGGDPDGYLVASFKQDGEKVTASVRSSIGDWRWLEGVYRNGRLWLSLFNGTWVFLVRAEMDAGGKLNGIWVKSSNEPIKWTAVKQDIDLPDVFTLTELTNDKNLLRFSYPSSDDPGKMISNSDPEFQGKPLVVALTTTGCPNGHDNAALLSKLYKEYHPKGLNMVFVNDEMTKNVELTIARIKRFRRLYDLPFPIAYSLAMNKKEMTAELPDLKRYVAWPTTVFYGPDGKVAAIHTGMEGPGTGPFYIRLENRYREIIESLLQKM